MSKYPPSYILLVPQVQKSVITSSDERIFDERYAEESHEYVFKVLISIFRLCVNLLVKLISDKSHSKLTLVLRVV